MKKTLMFVILLSIMSSLVLAEDENKPEVDKVLKVYVVKTKAYEGKSRHHLMRIDYGNLELAIPTDAELAEAKKAIEDTGVAPGDLKVGQMAPLEFFILQVEKAYQDQPAGKVKTSNGIRIEKPTEEELDRQQKGLRFMQGLQKFGQNFELELGGGALLPISPGLWNAYQAGVNWDLGIGYQFSGAFDLLVNFEWSRFRSLSDSVANGYNFNQFNMALLAKFRLAPKGVRPYLYAGPAVSRGNYSVAFQNNGFDGTTSFRDQSAFMVEGGVGVEIPLFEQTHLFLQGGMVYDFIPDNTAGVAGLDQPLRIIPVQMGLVLGR